MRLLTLLFILGSSGAAAQNCSTIPGMSPSSAILVCGSSTFNQNSVSSCTGPSISSPCLPLVTSNSFWYRFHCYQSGIQGLGFVISPQSATDDYDWTIFDVTGLDPNVVYSDMSTQLSVNLCGFTGQTGCSPAGSSNLNCEGNTNLWNQLAPVQVGHDYLLMVTNWSNSGLGYGLSFTGGDAVIDNNVAPAVSSVSTVGCNTAQLKVVFSKDIRCNSVTATGSEFAITAGSFPITNITSLCSSGSNTITELTINLASALPAGNYNLVINNGGDGNTFLDACGVGITAGTQIPFTIGAQGSPVINNITFSGCAPTTLNLALSKPILCSSITATGSEFLLSPGSPVITSLQSACSAGQTYVTSLQLVLQNPLPHGNYQLTINNGSDGNTLTDTCSLSIPAGYNFPLVISQATTAPVIQSVGFNECQPNKLVLNFDKPVACNSLTAAGSEFSVSPGNWPITSIASSCSSGTLTSQVTLTLQNNLPAGNFHININNGSDGNTLADTCFAFISSGYTKPFVTTQAPAPMFDSVQVDNCNTSQVKVFYSHPINCGTVTAAGSEFLITGPSTVTIASVSGEASCSTSYSHWFILHLTQPINTMGIYTLHNRIGGDGNGIVDTCNAAQNINETINFNVSVKPDATFASSVRWGCVLDTIHVSHPGGDGINSWTWSFSDATSGSGQSASHYFNVSTVSADVQLIVSNGACSDTANLSIPLNNAFHAAFTQGADTTCINKPVSFTDASTGNNLQYEWQFGDNTTFNGQAPPVHTYSSNASHTISLICSNNHGCHDTASHTVYATALPVVSFSGLNSQYCTREPVSLIANLQGNISSYTWANGNGQTFQNNPVVSFSYGVQNNYTITLTANDRFCGSVPFSRSTNVYHVPVVDLGRDTALCPNTHLQLGIAPAGGLTYLWSTGAVTPQVTTGLSSATYTLTIDNHGCRGTDQIYVEMLEGCLIRVAGAFTPNGDGINDRLKAINAFLATNLTLNVYNRFGQLLFHTNNPLEGWDGRYKGQEQEAGTYIWQLSYTDPWTHLPVFQKGASILIR